MYRTKLIRPFILRIGMVLRVVNTEKINQISVELDVYDKYKQKTTLSWLFPKEIMSETCQYYQIDISTC